MRTGFFLNTFLWTERLVYDAEDANPRVDASRFESRDGLGTVDVSESQCARIAAPQTATDDDEFEGAGTLKGEAVLTRPYLSAERRRFFVARSGIL
jgi:hypothetical protein